MEITAIDHLVLTVKDMGRTVEFYCRSLGMKKEVFDNGRLALRFGRQKINLHQAGQEFEPKAESPQPGSADLCLVTAAPLEEAMAEIRACGIRIEEGPVDRTGAGGPMRSFYIRDPDGNLIEIASYKGGV
jgi:catechol 2,3-dioxygenase-like lactoylglutathione lyase family enzyme